MKTTRRWLMFVAPLMLATVACTCGLTQQLGNLAQQQAEQITDDALATAEAMAGDSLATAQAEVETNMDEAMQDVPDDSGNGQDDFEMPEFGGDASDSPFPIPDDPSVTIGLLSDIMVSYLVEMSVDDLAAYYRTELSAQGYTEREDLTVFEGSVVSMVFDGHPSGQALVVQLVDLGDGTSNASVFLEDV